MSESDRSEESLGSRTRPRAYTRGGSISNMAQLLGTGETEPKSPLARRLVMAGVAIAFLVMAVVWLLSG